MSKYYLLIVGIVVSAVGGLAEQAGRSSATFLQIAGGVFIAIFAGLFMFGRGKK